MEARIELELRGKKPSELVDLLLDNCKATKISGLSDEFTSLTTMSLINVGLTTLVENCPRLYHVNLCANKIKDIESLAPLKKLEELAALDLFDCDLKYLDGFDIHDIEADLSDDGEGEDGMDDEEEEADLSDEEEEGVESGDENGLAYLDSSKAVQDEDESEDFVANGNGATKNVEQKGSKPARGTKRQHEQGEEEENDEESEEPAAKSSA
uniref:Acidic leucine-rich nuclear phosphoprotein 32 family member E n=1 Tax=Ditylenchus dipsaci TaxID=166011 RepID=A0A915CVX3_9BILA